MVKSWTMFMDPSDPLSCILAVLDVFEEFGRHVGREAQVTVPALSRVWRSAAIDHGQVFSVITRFAESWLDMPAGTFAGRLCLRTVARCSESRPLLVGPFPASSLIGLGHVQSSMDTGYNSAGQSQHPNFAAG